MKGAWLGVYIITGGEMGTGRPLNYSMMVYVPPKINQFLSARDAYLVIYQKEDILGVPAVAQW